MSKKLITAVSPPFIDKSPLVYYLLCLLVYGRLTYLAWHRQKRPFDNERLQQELITKFNQIDGISLPFEAMQRQPKFKLTDFSSQEQLTELLSVYEWMIEQVKLSD